MSKFIDDADDMEWSKVTQASVDEAKLTDEERLASFRAARQSARPLSRAETVAYLENPPHLLNGSERLPAGKRGPRTERTHYDLRFERLKGRYHTIKTLPDAGADARRGSGEPLARLIQRKVEEVAGAIPTSTPERDLTGLVSRELDCRGFNFDPKAIREALRHLGRIKEITTPD